MGGSRCISFMIALFAICLFPLCLANSDDKPVNCSVLDKPHDSPYQPNENDLWPGGIVKYKLDYSTLSKKDVYTIQDAQTEIESKTCIVFQHRSDDDVSFATIGVDNSICGDATICRQQNASYVKFGGECRNKKTMVHELGHTLCLHHEDLPSPKCDHNNYLLPMSKFKFLYDFWSQMASQNTPNDLNNWYKQFHADTRRSPNDTGLSVMDADKINSLYNCQGCYSHRWKFISQVTKEDEQYMIRFGRTADGKPLYACRGYINQELCVGKYRADERKCYLGYGGTEHVHSEWAQVYLDPAWVKGGVPSKGIYNSTQDLGDEHFVKVSYGRIYFGGERDYDEPDSKDIENIKKYLVPAGSKFEGNYVSVGYIVVKDAPMFNGTSEKVIGKLWEHELSTSTIDAHFLINGVEIILNEFKIFRCNEKTFLESHKQ